MASSSALSLGTSIGVSAVVGSGVLVGNTVGGIGVGGSERGITVGPHALKTKVSNNMKVVIFIAGLLVDEKQTSQLNALATLASGLTINYMDS
jgi:hypothetical protein